MRPLRDFQGYCLLLGLTYPTYDLSGTNLVIHYLKFISFSTWYPYFSWYCTFVFMKYDQVDLRGDTFGLLAAHPVTPLLSLHHPDYTDPIFPNMTTTQALKHLFKAASVDPQRMLQQTICYNRWFSWTISVSWGYAVQVFPHHMSLREVLKVQETFKQWKKGNMLAKAYTFNTRGTPPDPCKRPSVFYLDNVSFGNDGIIISSYKRSFQNCSNDDLLSPKRLEEVKVVTKKLDLDIKQVPLMCYFY